MKYYTYVEPGESGNPVYVTKSEKDIIREYFPYWSKRMKQVNKQHEISFERCIQDWVDIHWATEGKKNVTVKKTPNSKPSKRARRESAIYIGDEFT